MRRRIGAGPTARLLALVPGVRLRLAGLVGMLLAVTATYVAQGLGVAQVIALMFAGTATFPAVAGLLGGVAALVGVRAVLLSRYEVMATALSSAVKAELRARLVSRVFDLGPGWTQRSRTGDLQTTLVDGVEAVEPYLGRYLPQTVGAVLGAATVASVIAVLDPLVGLIVVLSAAVTPVTPALFNRMIKRRTDAWLAQYWGIYAENLDAVQGMSTLKAFGAARRYGEELGVKAEEFSRASVKVVAVWGGYTIAVRLAVAVGTAGAVGVGALHYLDGSLSRLGLLIILLLAAECFRPLRELTDSYHDSAPFRSHIHRIWEVLDADPEVADPSVPGVPPRARPLSVEFAGVTFRYRERDVAAVEDIDLEVSPGERVAIVGRSGAGKSTMVSLVLRFFDPQQGRVLIGGQDVRDLTAESLRSMVSVVSQDTFLFHDTVRNNLLLARADATEEDLVGAAVAAHAHDFILGLPDGYETVIGERGLRLSGGQRQRIAIARALLKDAPVLILDEATSSIDARNEAGIHQALGDLARGRTTLVIAHRLSTVRDADRVVVLREGRIAEIGDHRSLIEREGDYAELAAAQGAR